MAVPVTTRRIRGRETLRPFAALRRPRHTNTLARSVKKGRPSWQKSTRQLPYGFMRAVIDEFVKSSRANDRARRIRTVLEEFNQPEDVLPSKVRRFLKRFEVSTGESHGR